MSSIQLLWIFWTCYYSHNRLLAETFYSWIVCTSAERRRFILTCLFTTGLRMKCNFSIKFTSCRSFFCPVILLRWSSSALAEKFPEQILFYFPPLLSGVRSSKGTYIELANTNESCACVPVGRQTESWNSVRCYGAHVNSFIYFG